ncbi:hypothetical protein [Spirochaeta cellobiosiphila]|uniref:hypothetical protein n=1 Tax=Spirochaeta cellobiosiphila TaxID=504483 RepID=UPI0004177BA4|nr:hypothetical protein [Spirochaeta cellobiosiphila]
MQQLITIILVYLLVGSLDAFLFTYIIQKEKKNFIANLIIAVLSAFAGGTIFSFILIIFVKDHLELAKFYFVPAIIFSVIASLIFFDANKEK